MNRGEPPPAPSAGVELTLASGAALRLPVGATPHASPKWLPDAVQRAHVYRLGDETRLLMVTELGRPEGGCDGALDKEWQRTKEVQADTDGTRLGVRRMGGAEQLTVAGRRALYSESQQRGFGGGADGGRPFVAVASLVVCHREDELALMLASRSAALPADAKSLLLAVGASYRPALR